MAKVGRPSKYSQELSDRICEELAMGNSLRTVCKDEAMPAIRTVFYWLRSNKEFMHQYARAKEESADAMADEVLDISDDGTNDWVTKTDKHGNEYETVNNEVLQRSRLRVDTRKWLMSKMKPKKYGDKIDMTSNGETISPVSSLTDEQINERIKDYLKRNTDN